MKVVSVEKMQTVEKYADANGFSYDCMMHHAGRGVGEWILSHVSVQRGVVGLVGSGNNGGDTLIALTLLSQRGVRTNAFLVRPRDGDALVQEYITFGGSVIDISQHQNLEYLQAALIPNAVVLDGILGTGLRLPIRNKLLDIMTDIYNLVENRSTVLKIAVDCPSGVDCDTGDVSIGTIPADHTLCMAAIKQGLLQPPARSYCGNLHIIDIGINELAGKLLSECPVMLDMSFVRENLPARPDNGHKGTFGTCLVVAGSRPYTGAAFLAGKAAYRAGCGLVHVGTTQSVQESLSGQLIEAVWTVLPSLNDGYDPEGAGLLMEGLKAADSIVVGPGWGLQDENAVFLKRLLQVIPSTLPALFDADGLKLLNQIECWWELLPENTVLTPHPGEMSILSGLDIQEIQSNRWDVAKEYAERWGVVLILKGAVTVIAAPESEVLLNPTSSSALATAGSGDVLSGVIGGLLAQHVSAREAAAIGVWMHSRAAISVYDRRKNDASVTSLDILEDINFGSISETKEI